MDEGQASRVMQPSLPQVAQSGGAGVSAAGSRLSSISKVWVSTIEALVHAAFRWSPRGDAGRSLCAPRDRLVAEASEHVLSFDWADAARQVGEVYEELARPLSLRTG